MSELQLQLELFDFTEMEQEIQLAPKKSELNKLTFDLMDALRAPIITYPSPWNESIPQKLLDNIPITRMIALMKEEQLATIPEVVAYIYPASLSFPLNQNWSNIYLWISKRYLEQYQSKDSEEIAAIAPETLDDYEQKMLNKLRIWIYDKRRKALKERNKKQ